MPTALNVRKTLRNNQHMQCICTYHFAQDIFETMSSSVVAQSESTVSDTWHCHLHHQTQTRKLTFAVGFYAHFYESTTFEILNSQKSIE